MTNVNEKEFLKKNMRVKHGPHNMDIYPDLKKQLKTATLKETTRFKKNDREYDHFINNYNGRTIDYEIEILDANKERSFKMAKELKEAESSLPLGPKPSADMIPSNNSVTNHKANFNYQKTILI